jgi:NAD(P)-dependent dehydrogenase (short-subunit alcohol dehydrogenase family)
MNMSKSVLDLSKEFVGRRALVTGGSRGIGAAVAQRLLDAGATVAVTARSRHEQTPKNVTFIEADLRTNDGAKAAVAEALRALGDIDILINNAGAAKTFLTGAATIPDEEWVDAVNSNYLSAVRVTAAALPSLRKSKHGVIINVSSGGAWPLPPPLLHYGAAKAALNAYSKGLAQELGPAGIRVCIVTPGSIHTQGGNEIRKTLTDAMGMPAEAILQQVPLRRVGQPEEVAEVIALIASDRGAYMTSNNTFVDGGMGTL